MNGLIDAAFSRARVASLLFAMIVAIGAVAYIAIHKEAEGPRPDRGSLRRDGNAGPGAGRHRRQGRSLSSGRKLAA
jgi:hypothetical protein